MTGGYNGYQEYTGTLVDLRLYPFGVDPLTASDGDTDPGMCNDRKDYWGADHEDHPFAPFLPPEQPALARLVPNIVRVVLYPLRAYTVA